MSNKIYPKSATKTQRSEFRMVWLVISVLGLLGSLVWLAYIIIGILNIFLIVVFYWMFKHSRSA
jgi:uncharacterized membrane protein YuzA (DUF378 family)